MEDIEKPLIKNILLKNYIEVILNKENITKKDLGEVKEIVLNSENILGEYNKVYIEEISLFPNLEEITIKNLGLKLEDMQLLRKVKKVSFRNCEVNGIEYLENVKELTINNTEIIDFENITKLTNIESLKLININLNQFDFIEDFKNLKELAIENVNGFEMEKIDKPLKIENLSLMGIDKLDLNILSKYKNLNEISVYDNDIEKVRENLKELRDRKIKIMLNGIYEYKE